MEINQKETTILSNILNEMLRYERLTFGLPELSEKLIIKVCTNFNTLYPKKLALSYLKLGSAYSNLRELDLAISSYTQALTLNPDDIDAHNNLASVYRSKGEYNLAMKEYGKAIDLSKRI